MRIRPILGVALAAASLIAACSGTASTPAPPTGAPTAAPVTAAPPTEVAPSPEPSVVASPTQAPSDAAAPSGSTEAKACLEPGIHGLLLARISDPSDLTDADIAKLVAAFRVWAPEDPIVEQWRTEFLESDEAFEYHISLNKATVMLPGPEVLDAC